MSDIEEPIAVDLSHDTLVEIRRIPDLLPRNTRGNKIGLATVYRWIARDALPTLKIGGRQYTSTQALQRWCESRTPRGHAQSPKVPSLRQGAVDRAAAEARVILGGTARTNTETARGMYKGPTQNAPKEEML